MSSRIRALRASILFAAAAAGLVGAHLLGYVAIAPEAASRSLLLSQTGHGYLSRVVALALASAIVAGVASAALGAVRARTRVPGRMRLGAVALRLSVLQVLGFVALEVLERLVVGAPLSDLTGSVLVLGLPLQILVAFGAALIIVLLEHAAETVTRLLLPAGAERAVRRIPPPPGRVPAQSPEWAAPAIRAPPALLAEAL